MFGIDSFNSTPILPTLNMPSHSFTLHTENAKTFLASTEAELLEGYVPATDESGNAYVLQNIQSDYCPDKGGDVSEDCSAGPFTQFTIRGTEGGAGSGRWHWGPGGQSLFIHDFDNSSSKSGAVEIDIADGYMVKLQIDLTDPLQGKDFKDNHWSGWGTNDTDGVLSKGELTTTVLMKGGDKLSIDIDDEWSGTTNFYLKVQGEEVAYSSSGDDLVNDNVKITLLGVWEEGTGGSNGGGSDNGGSDNGGGDTTDSGGIGMGTIAIVGAGVVGLVLLLK